MYPLRERLKLYVIPDIDIGAPLSLEEQTRLAICGGASAIQLRAKNMGGRQLLGTAKALAGICKRNEVLFIVNDRLDVALLAGADGVHLGQEDLPVAEVRKAVSSEFLVGASAHTAEQAVAAERDGADYLGLGAVFGTNSKNDVTVIGLEGLRKAAAATSLPSVAIGGIALENLGDVMGCGVDGVSVISAAVAGDVEKKTRALSDFLRLQKDGQ